MEIIPLHKQTAMISSKLVHAKYKLTLSELSIFLASLGQIHQSKPINKDQWITITPMDYAMFRGCTIEAGIMALEEVKQSLWKNEILIKEDNNTESLIRMVISISRDKSTNLKFKYHPEFIPLISELSKYITCKLSDLGKLQLFRSYRLYFLIKEATLYKKQFNISLSLDEIKDIFGIEGDSYNDFKILNNRMIKPMVKEVKELLLPNLEVSYTKDGKRITGIIFNGIEDK